MNRNQMMKTLLTLFLGLLLGYSAQANESRVEANRVAEVSLVSAKPHANPFMEVELPALVSPRDFSFGFFPNGWRNNPTET